MQRPKEKKKKRKKKCWSIIKARKAPFFIPPSNSHVRKQGLLSGSASPRCPNTWADSLRRLYIWQHHWQTSNNPLSAAGPARTGRQHQQWAQTLLLLLLLLRLNPSIQHNSPSTHCFFPPSLSVAPRDAAHAPVCLTLTLSAILEKKRKKTHTQKHDNRSSAAPPYLLFFFFYSHLVIPAKLHHREPVLTVKHVFSRHPPLHHYSQDGCEGGQRGGGEGRRKKNAIPIFPIRRRENVQTHRLRCRPGSCVSSPLPPSVCWCWRGWWQGCVCMYACVRVWQCVSEGNRARPVCPSPLLGRCSSSKLWSTRILRSPHQLRLHQQRPKIVYAGGKRARSWEENLSRAPGRLGVMFIVALNKSWSDLAYLIYTLFAVQKKNNNAW